MLGPCHMLNSVSPKGAWIHRPRTFLVSHVLQAPSSVPCAAPVPSTDRTLPLSAAPAPGLDPFPRGSAKKVLETLAT